MESIPALPLSIGVFLNLSASCTFAQSWSGGQAGTISGLGGLTLSGDTFTWTRGAASAGASLSIVGNTSIQNAPLLAIRGLWVLDKNGNAVSGLITTATDGYIVNTSGNKTYWNADTNPAGYYSDDAGFGNNKAFLALVSDSTLQSYGKNANAYTQGSYRIQGLSSWINLPTTGEYKIGMDYMVGLSNGTATTGRVFFTAPASLRPSNVPEGSSGLLASIAVLGIATTLIIRRKRTILSVQS